MHSELMFLFSYLKLFILTFARKSSKGHRCSWVLVSFVFFSS